MEVIVKLIGYVTVVATWLVYLAFPAILLWFIIHLFRHDK